MLLKAEWHPMGKISSIIKSEAVRDGGRGKSLLAPSSSASAASASLLLCTYFVPMHPYKNTRHVCVVLVFNWCLIDRSLRKLVTL